jgi:hypothetical protein
MSDTPGWAGSQGPDEQFTVPVPQPSRAALPQTGSAGPGGAAPAGVAGPTQAIPVVDHTRELPVAEPGWASPPPATAPVPANPYAGQPVWPAPVPSRAPSPGGRGTARAADDPLIAQVGVALFWVTVGWWGFLLVRLLGYLSRFGVADTMLIRTIDRGAEETILAAGVSVLAAVLLVSVDRGRRSPLTIAAVALALATVGIAIWRVLP